MQEIIYTPTKETIENSNIKKFMNKHGIKNYNELLKKSLNSEWFYDAIVKDMNIDFYTPYKNVLEGEVQWTKWFINGKINIVHNCLDRYKDKDDIVFIWESENGEVKKYTYKQLYKEVNRLANALKELGIKKGDAIGLYLPMLPETIVSLFAILKIGGIIIPIFSGFSSYAIATRLSDADAKLLFTTEFTFRRGKKVSLKENVNNLKEQLPNLKNIIVVKREGEVFMKEKRDLFYDEIIKSKEEECETEKTDSEDIAFILYTSGTTGKPKGCVHAHSCLINVAKEVYYSFDLKKEDLFFWFTDIGWMMGPWMILGVQNFGYAYFLYEGAPDFPNNERLWQLIDKHKITILGISPTLIRMLMRYEQEIKKYNLSSLRILGSTGEPWDKESYVWFFKNVGKERCPIINISGGTDIMGCFLAPLPINELKPCCLFPALGMDIDVFDENGNSIRENVGYLVAKNSCPSMMRGIWKNKEKYIEIYWSRWKDIWNHGDWALIDKDGFWFLYGRADDTIKVAGRRIGPGEIEDALLSHNSVSETAVIGVPHEIKGEGIVCFVVLKKDFLPSENLKEELKNQVAKLLGKADKPEDIKFVNELPKTRNGKIMRRLIKAKFLGKELGDITAVENLSALDEIERAR